MGKQSSLAAAGRTPSSPGRLADRVEQVQAIPFQRPPPLSLTGDGRTGQAKRREQRWLEAGERADGEGDRTWQEALRKVLEPLDAAARERTERRVRPDLVL